MEQVGDVDKKMSTKTRQKNIRNNADLKPNIIDE